MALQVTHEQEDQETVDKEQRQLHYSVHATKQTNVRDHKNWVWRIDYFELCMRVLTRRWCCMTQCFVHGFKKSLWFSDYNIKHHKWYVFIHENQYFQKHHLGIRAAQTSRCSSCQDEYHLHLHSNLHDAFDAIGSNEHAQVSYNITCTACTLAHGQSWCILSCLQRLANVYVVVWYIM